MVYLELSVPNFTGHFTQKAKPFGVTTQIVLKVPKVGLTTIRLLAHSNYEITEFLRSLTVIDLNWTEAKVRLHVQAIKPLVSNAPHWKNRQLMENRA